MTGQKWYLKTVDEVCDFYNTDVVDGLSSEDVAKRTEQYGYNELVRQEGTKWWKLLLQQFQDFMVLVLFGATLISAFLGEYVDAITILCIVVINAILGFVQEFKAERSMEALQQLSAPNAHVIRNGQSQQIAARELVPGDLILLEAGDRVPADARLAETINAAVEESALTGESVPVGKDADKEILEDVSLGDCKNMVFLGTSIVRGHARAIVVETAMHTEMGRIANLIQKQGQEDTPLQRRLESMGKIMVWTCLLICSIVVITGILKGESVFVMCMSGISLAVAAIPEGLPAIVTVSLALGVQRMIRRNAIIRKLPAVETLGCTTVICSDKTGTLTQNKMTVRSVYTKIGFYDVLGTGYDPRGEFLAVDRRSHPDNDKCLRQSLIVATLCNNAQLKKSNSITISSLWRKNVKQDNEDWHIDGDPTEGALLVAAAKSGIWPEEMSKEYRRILELPFESERRRQTVVCKKITTGEQFVFIKGAPDAVLDLCSAYLSNDAELPLTSMAHQQILQANESMADKALRVLAVAYKKLDGPLDGSDNAKLEQNMVFCGMLGMIDPPREEVRHSVETCKKAGIKTVMITGDHPATAVAIARDLGMLKGNSMALTGKELGSMSNYELERIVDVVAVYARVSPAHKLRIVQALKKRGHIVAMTGDGVNDAPAIKEADIGISMGKTGTDVAKEASAMVLTDDNFATIVAAIEEGRGIYDNIRKFIRYLLASNTGEVVTMFVATLIGLPLPILPVQILWINLVTDGLPAMALSMEPTDKEVMNREPRHPKESVFSRGLSSKIVLRGLQIGVSCVAVFAGALYFYHDLALARTMAFCTLVFSQLFYVFDCKSDHLSILDTHILSNPALFAAVVCSMTMQLLAVYNPFLQKVFETTPLDAFQICIVLVIASWTVIKAVIAKVLFKPLNKKISYIKI